MSKLRFKTCRLLFQNVWNRKPTKIQGRILRRLKRKNRSFKRNLSSRRNLNSYIQSQTTRKLSLFYGNLPITEMHRRRKQSTIPFLLNLETRLDVILVRIHFRETLPQARQPISHRKVCVNNRMVNRTHFKVSHGDLISFQDNAARIRRKKIKRSFFRPIIQKWNKEMKILKILWARRVRKVRKVRWARRAHLAHKGKRKKEKKGKGKNKVEKKKYLIKKKLLKNMDRLVRMGRRTKTKWFQQEKKTQKEDSLLPKKRFFQMKKCLKKEKRKNPRMLRLSSFEKKKRAEKKIILLLFDLDFLLSNTRNPSLSMEKRNSILFSFFSMKKKIKVDSILLKIMDSIFSVKWCSDEEIKEEIIKTLSDLLFTRNKKRNKKRNRKRQIKKIELPTHYSEVNHRTSKAVVSYRPNIGHIPHDIKMKDLNLLLRIGNKCG